MANQTSILVLPAELWTSIADYLEADVIYGLKLVGNSRLSSLLLRATSNLQFRFKVTQGRLNIQSILNTSSDFHQLQRLSISSENFALWPFDVSQLPPQLSSLSLNFLYALDAFLFNGDLSIIVPHLKHLELLGGLLAPRRFSLAKFPPNLETLNLAAKGVRPMKLEEGDLNSLPQSLQSLTLDGTSGTIKGTNWSPLLHTFRFYSALTDTCTVDMLPRSVTVLAVPIGMETAQFDLSFPWRDFFPFLSDLHFSWSYMLPQNFLKLLVLPTELSGARELIELTNLPNVLCPPNPGCYPIWRRIQCYTRTISSTMCDNQEVSYLLPFLPSLSVFGTADSLQLYLPHLSSLTEMSYFSSFPPEAVLPPTLKYLECISVPPSILPPGLTSLSMAGAPLAYEIESWLLAKDFRWPASLTNLSVLQLALTPDLIETLPTSITSLACKIVEHSPGDLAHSVSSSFPTYFDFVSMNPYLHHLKDANMDWPVMTTGEVLLGLVATKMVNLKKLNVIITTQSAWSYRSIIPFVSRQLHDLAVDARFKLDLDWWSVFLGSPQSRYLLPFLNQSIIPSSLQTLRLFCPAHLDVFILAMLPPNLTVFRTFGAFVSDKTASQLNLNIIQSLPRSLTSFEWDSLHRPVSMSLTMEMLAALPRSLTRLELPQDIALVDDKGVEVKRKTGKRSCDMDYLKLLPPNLCHLSVNPKWAPDKAYLQLTSPNALHLDCSLACAHFRKQTKI